MGIVKRQSQQHEQLQQLQVSMHATTDIKIMLNTIKGMGEITIRIKVASAEAKSSGFCVRSMLQAVAETHKV